jgi:TPR repeat protein
MTETRNDLPAAEAIDEQAADPGFDMANVKEATSFSKAGLIIGGGLLAALFLFSLLSAPSEPASSEAALAEIPTEAAADAVAEGAAEAAADAMAEEPAPGGIASVHFPEIARACNLATTPAAADQCNLLGNKYDSGTEVTKDLLLATQSYDLGCAKGSMMACANAGLMYGGANGMDPQPDLSFRLLQRACDNNIMHGCAELGYNYQNGIGVTADPVQARYLYELACTQGWQAGCDYRDAIDQLGNYMPQ